ncbi:Mss4-like protein [Mycena crocata]|nr:Mss4-like protein [Mycena crocata]
MPHSGSCLCGQTTVNISSTHSSQVICHCTDCKKACGSEFSANAVVPQENVKIEGPVKTYVGIAASGNPVTYIFCSNCGSSISKESPAFGDGQAVRSGMFSDFTDVPIGAECKSCFSLYWNISLHQYSYSVFCKSRWTVFPAVKDAAQMSTMTA